MDRWRPRTGADPAGPTMPDASGPQLDHQSPTIYRIRVRGHLDGPWADAPDGLCVAWDPSGDTILTIPVTDQAALHGLLRRLRDVGVPLVSVNPAFPGPTTNSLREKNR